MHATRCRRDNEENVRLEMDIEALDREFRECSQEIKDVYKATQGMETDLRNRSLREAERDQLKQKTKELQVELEGLEQRMVTLQDGLPGSGASSRSGSFIFNRSSNSADSFQGGAPGRCSERCVRSNPETPEAGRCVRPGRCSMM